ncbi:MAG: pyruvate/oxaloacetate carboxyltransferase [Methanomassiliicoccales archaeon]|nr:pyruvate/oxaloacetate carboxyltransferase [Methanomassiliicoccales archaeon]
MVKITDTVLRDAHQSLLATRMRTEDMLPIAPLIDEIGYWSVEMWGGATFDSCLRFLREDPWERITKLRKAMPNTHFQMLLRGQNIVGYRHYPDDILEKFIHKAHDRGIDVFRVFDALNDPRNLETAMRVAGRVGAVVEAAISYTTSPVHTIKGFVELGKKLEGMGADTICIKDMAGLIAPQAAFDLVKGLKEEVSLPIHVHSHMTSGMAEASYMKAVEAGADIIDTAISSLSMGTSQPPTESTVAMLRGTEWDTGLDLKKLAEIAKYFAEVRKKYSDFESEHTAIDTDMLIYQIPGGMISNLATQLKEAKQEQKMHDVLEEVPRVRADLGYIPLVTPTSQIVGTQAMLNVITGERYKRLNKETKDVVRGMYGKTPAPISAEIRKKIIGDEKPITVRPADLLPPEFDKLALEIKEYARSDEDVLSYALFPQVAIDFFKERVLAEQGANGRDLAALAALFVQLAEARSKSKQTAGGAIDAWKLASRRESVRGGGWLL